jgi:hypothetical protein
MSNAFIEFVRRDLIRRFKHGAVVAHFGYEDEDIAMQKAGIGAVNRTVRELDAFGFGGRSALAPLLDDSDQGIRAFAAGHLLGLMPERALEALKDIYDNGSARPRMTAAQFIEEYEKGEL